MQGFLGVTASLAGRRWVGPSADEDRARDAVAQATGLAPAVAAVLARRGVPPEEARAFLSPALRDLLPDPMGLRDMGAAADRLVAALDARERIAVFADYDVDGGACAALLVSWLRAMGHGATLYVPDRIAEGYGPNAEAMKALSGEHDLIVCVDCGAVSHEPIAAARADVLVIDHHLGDDALPPALAVVNPNRRDEDGGLGHLCAAAVVFLLLVEVRRRLRARGDESPDLMDSLDLVALATVADVAPLTGVNRAFVRQGLKVMARRGRPGLAALADAAKLDAPPSSHAIAYALGPRINAGGRVGEAALGARLLCTDDPDEAAAMAERLDAMNAERRAIEAATTEAAIEQATARGLDGPLAWAAAEGWHPGILGIVAARLKEAANRPAFVIALDGDEGRGSGRSAAGIDLGSCVRRLVDEGMLAKGGGHPMAAGLTVARDRVEPAMERLGDLVARQGAARLGPGDTVIDGVLMPGAATVELIDAIEEAGPYGAGAPAPRFAFPDVAIAHARRVGENHLKLALGDGTGGRLDAIAFRACDKPLGAALENHGGAPFHFAGRLEVNHWGGRRRAQLLVDDAAPAS